MKVKDASAQHNISKKVYTYQDYIKMPDDGKQYEILDGELIVVAAPRIVHQDVGIKLKNKLYNFNQHEQFGKLFDAPIDVVQPDILFISKERYEIITEMHINGAPDLIIEILSPSSAYYDLIEKKELYEKNGVKE